MKTLNVLSAVFGTAAILSLVSGLLTLFTQPFPKAVTNDILFASFFMLGCIATALFLYTENRIHGTINSKLKEYYGTFKI